MNIDPITAKRFWSKVDKRGHDECWNWTAGRFPFGYGAFYVHARRKNMGAHVVSWLLAHQGWTIVNNGQVCHRCDNPPCCNPSHLFLGTVADNFHDSMRKGRRNRLVLGPASEHPEAMPRGSNHWAAKRGPLNDANVLAIRTMLMEGKRQCEIMRALNLPRKVVQRVAANRVWRHIQP